MAGIFWVGTKIVFIDASASANQPWSIGPKPHAGRLDPEDSSAKIFDVGIFGGLIFGAGEPLLARPSDTVDHPEAAASVLRAIKACAPFHFPVVQYASWRTIATRFDGSTR
ncbi:MAG TPA: hypothetical protein VMM15_09150 [Bradyrhizobium sp.]|nr:hypothetical protein [Bradyrhizobium sp.]